MARRQGTATIGTRRTTATNIFISQVQKKNLQDMFE
jgi:hypothetical protein